MGAAVPRVGVRVRVTVRTAAAGLPPRNIPLDGGKKTVFGSFARLRGREIVRVACIGMWLPYRGAVRATMPDVAIVVDEFHVVRMANHALDLVRDDLKKGCTGTERRRLIRERHVLLRRRADLNEMGQIPAGGECR